MYKTPYSLLEEAQKPKLMNKSDYEDYIKLDIYCRNGCIYLLSSFFSFVYPLLGRLFLYRVYEITLEHSMNIFDAFGLEIHFLRYIYYGIIDEDDSPVASMDIVMLLLISFPILAFLLEFLTVPAHIKWYEYEGKLLLFSAPALLLVFFFYTNESLLCTAIVETFSI
jgi:hypothetical protein